MAAVAVVLLTGHGRSALNAIRSTAGVKTSPPASVTAVGRPAPIVYRPAGSGSRKLPLVVALYGAGGCPQCMEGVTNFEALAQRYGFVVAYPGSSTSPPWNSPSDLAYVRSFIDGLLNGGGIDPSRVYLTGFSAGGRATYQYGCALNAKLAAIAVVSSVMRGYPCRLRHPVSELTIDGGTESVALFGNRAGIPTATATAQRWQRMDSCATGISPAVSYGGPAGLVRQSVWGPCLDGSRIGLYVVSGGYHTWPGTSSALGVDRLYDASTAIWQFFASVSASSSRVPDASLVGLAAQGRAGARVVTATLALGEPVLVRMSISRAGHTLASLRRELGSSGAVSLAVPKRVHGGRVRVRLLVRDAYGRTTVIVRFIRVG